MLRRAGSLTLLVFAGCASSSSGETPAGAAGSAGASAASPIGGPCPNGVTDCATGLECAGEDPGGQCFKKCAPGNDADCGDATLACSFEGHCYIRCAATSDCKRAAEGYVCKDDVPPRPPVKFCDVQ